jgi:hypothetical protein
MSTSDGGGFNCCKTRQARREPMTRPFVVIHHGHSHKTACGKSTASAARSWSGQRLFDSERVLGRLNPPVAIRPHQSTRCRSFTSTQMKIFEIDHGRLDISVEEPIQHVIIHTFSVNLKNVNALDVICLCSSNASICTIGSAHGTQTEEEKTVEVRDSRGTSGQRCSRASL